MDDVEFVDPNKSFQKDKFMGIVEFLNGLVYELIKGGEKEGKEHKELRGSAVLLINDLYHKNFRTKLLPSKIFEVPKLNNELA